jgi:hypothetical protein
MDEKAALLELLRLALASKSPDHVGDLIKIGLPLLGVIVAAIISFCSAKRTAEITQTTQLELARASRRTELQKEVGNRRGVRFEDLIARLDRFNQGLTNYVTLVENAIEVRTSGPLSAAKMEEIEKSEKQFFDAFLDLLNADAKLLVLGHGELQLELRKFGEEAQEIYKEVHLKNSELTVARVEELKGSLRARRRTLLIRIGDEERKWWSAEGT